MLAGVVIVPVVSLLQKKDLAAEKRLDELFRPFSGLSEAVEQAADSYLEDRSSADSLKESDGTCEKIQGAQDGAADAPDADRTSEEEK